MYEIVKDNYSLGEFGTMADAVEHIKFLPAGRYIVRHWRNIDDEIMIAPRLGNVAINKR